MNTFKLKNDTVVCFVQNLSSEKTTLCLNFSISTIEAPQGTLNLMSRLLRLNLQAHLSNNIESSCELERDFLSISLSFTNQELTFALESFSNIIKNLVFEKFEEEKFKIREEIITELDLPKAKVLDNYYKALFEGHFYEDSLTKTLENLDNITKENLQKTYEQIILGGKKVLSMAGNIDIEQTKLLLDEYFGGSSDNNAQNPIPTPLDLKQNKTIQTIKKDAQKSLIVKGWIFPTYNSKDFAALTVLDAVLGFDGLCSRLFLELRGEQDIVYAVRSSYEPYKLCASFSIYISTDAKNIQKSLDATDKEIERLKKSEADEFELKYAKKKLLDKYKKTDENNVTLANQLAYYETVGLGFDFQAKIIENVKKVTSEQIQECANKYFDDKFIVSILRPE